MVVGKEEQQQWIIPLDLLCVHSGYFRSALKGGFAEANSKRVELLDEKPSTFKFVVGWLYTHKIKELAPRSNFDDLLPSFCILLEAYILAEYLQMPVLQNNIMRFMDDRVSKHHLISERDFAWAFEQADADTPLRKWVVTCCTKVNALSRLSIDELVEFEAFELLGEILKNVEVKERERIHFGFRNEYLVQESDLEDEE